MMLVFLLDRLRFGKLLKLYKTKDRISSNLLKRKQSNRKTSIMCRRLKRQKKDIIYKQKKRHILQTFLYFLNIRRVVWN